MLSRRATAVGVLSLIVTCVTAVPASAQGSDVRRPFRGLFGAPSSSDNPHSLVATASVYAAYDDNVYEALTNSGIRSPWFQQSGTYLGANGGLSYTFDKDGERFDLGIRAGAEVNYFRQAEQSDVLPAYQASADLGARLTRSLTFSMRQNVAYSSFYASSLAPSLDDDLDSEIGVIGNVDFGLFEQSAIQSITRAGLSHEIGRYASVGASYQLRARKSLETEFQGSPLREYTSQTASAGIQYAKPLSTSATLRLGYGIRWSDRKRVAGEPELMHNIDAGVDYSRALSFSRRTSFSFGTGSAITVGDEIPATDDNRKVRAWLTGNASLVHEIGRTWTAALRYSRGFRSQEGFDQLYFSNAINATIGGLISRRLSLGASATWSESSLSNDPSRHHRNESATVQATYGITSFLAAYASYVYVKYRHDEEILLNARFPQLDRQGVRVGLTTSVPLIR
jgi:hypothetical protein